MDQHWTRRDVLESTAAGLALTNAAKAADAPPGAAAAPDPLRMAANVERDVVFGTGGGLDLRCDVYRPTGAMPSKRTAILQFHGGGWAVGDKSSLAARAQPLASLGYVNIAAQYRLSGVARWPAQIEDVKAAIRWTRANAARLDIDPARIVLLGYSAGGYLALFAAGTQNVARYEGNGGHAGVATTVAACLSYFAPTGEAAGPGFRRGLPLPPGSSEAAWQEVDVESHLKGMPPTVLFHGLADTWVAPEVSQRLATKLRAAGVVCELHEFGGVSHEFVEFPEFNASCTLLCESFLDRYVVKPRTYPPFTPGRGRAPAPGGGTTRGPTGV